jgi:hypothetical protein
MKQGAETLFAVPPSTAKPRRNGEANRLSEADRPVHDWYRFVLSFPPHLVRDCLARFGIGAGKRVLDPFCGTGTTLVECKKNGIASVGIEANPFPFFASQVKTDWSVDPDGLFEHASCIAEAADRRLSACGLSDSRLLESPGNGPRRKLRFLTLPEEALNLLLTNSISPRPLHKTLVLLQEMKSRLAPEYHRYELLALAKGLVTTIGNLHFGPEVGVGPPKSDAPVVTSWIRNIGKIAEDLRLVRENKRVRTRVFCLDSRTAPKGLEPGSIDAVITSPPYPNEKDYTRTTRLESVLLGFVGSKEQLKGCKKNLVRSNTRNVYKDDDDDAWVSDHPEIGRIADQIETRRKELGKTSGFERLYARVTKLYFGGMARHLAMLREFLRPGAQLAYVVGDQASYLRIMIRTGSLLSKIAQGLGYEAVGIDLFRTRLSTTTREQLREEVVILRWAG